VVGILGRVAVIDTYVEELSGALRGPRRHKADLLAEARDSLVDAAEAYQGRGLDREPAERRAVTEFGAVPQIAPAYQAELAVGQGRRTALIVAAVLATQQFGAELAWRAVDTGPWHSSGAYAFLAEATDIVGLVALAAALGVVFLFTRWGGPRLARVTGLATIGCYGFFLAAGVVLTFFGPLAPTLTTGPGLLVYALTTSVPLVLVGLSARRCLAAAKATPAR
jgi:hypothetical protein